jgi:hypothetical protein
LNSGDQNWSIRWLWAIESSIPSRPPSGNAAPLPERAHDLGDLLGFHLVGHLAMDPLRNLRGRQDVRFLAVRLRPRPMCVSWVKTRQSWGARRRPSARYAGMIESSWLAICFHAAAGDEGCTLEEPPKIVSAQPPRALAA